MPCPPHPLDGLRRLLQLAAEGREVPLSRLKVGMAEDGSDRVHVGPAEGQDGGRGVAKIVETGAWEPRRVRVPAESGEEEDLGHPSEVWVCDRLGESRLVCEVHYPDRLLVLTDALDPGNILDVPPPLGDGERCAGVQHL